MAKNHNIIDSSGFLTLDDKIEATLLEKRVIFLCDVVESESAKAVIRKLWFLELSNPGQPIVLVINSPGGSVDSGFAIWDHVKMISSPVTTVVSGLAASMGSVLSLCAAPKRRFATKHSRIMIHQPLLSGVIRGQATDLEIQALEMLKTRKTLVKIYVEATGLDEATVDRAVDRDTWMTPQEAMEFGERGLIDGIVSDFRELIAANS